MGHTFSLANSDVCERESEETKRADCREIEAFGMQAPWARWLACCRLGIKIALVTLIDSNVEERDGGGAILLVLLVALETIEHYTVLEKLKGDIYLCLFVVSESGDAVEVLETCLEAVKDWMGANETKAES